MPEVPEDLAGTSDPASEPAEGPRMPLGGATGGEAPTPGGFLDSIKQFMTAPLDGSQGVTVRRRRGLDYRESQPSGFGSAMWATAPLAENVSLPGRPSEGADSSEAEAWRMLQASEEAWDSEREEYCRALRHVERDMEHLQAALVQAHQVAPAPRAGAATAPAARHQFSLASLNQLRRLPLDPPQSQYQLSLLIRHQSRPQFQFLLQHQCQPSLSNLDPPRLRCQASRLFSQPQEGSPCCQLHLLCYQSHL
uniref:Uncharacterized protein n=1 Tax=Sphaerodactylus townsendi TaxID=933632 RepID=A0ACB8EC32_9SAUR